MTGARRLENWPALLAAELERLRDRPIAWGEHDCCLCAASLIGAMTGHDPAGELRGSYRDVKGARRIVKRHGGSLETFVHCIAADHGWTWIDPRFAQRGDLVLLAPAEPAYPAWPQALGICLGATAAVPGEAGLSFPAMRAAAAAWRV